jgi:hypothetical protein
MSKTSSLENMALQNGLEYISDTAAHTPPSGKAFIAIQAATACVIAALAGDKITGNTIATAALPENGILYGRFSSVTLTSGTAYAYKSGL